MTCHDFAAIDGTFSLALSVLIGSSELHSYFYLLAGDSQGWTWSGTEVIVETPSTLFINNDDDDADSGHQGWGIRKFCGGGLHCQQIEQYRHTACHRIGHPLVFLKVSVDFHMFPCLLFFGLQSIPFYQIENLLSNLISDVYPLSIWRGLMVQYPHELYCF